MGVPLGTLRVLMGSGTGSSGFIRGHSGHFPNCAQIALVAKWWSYFAVLTRMDPDDPDGYPVSTSGIVTCTSTRNLETI